ncbi:hypothetical protein GGS23DRAFT_30907 [Durotheca rogersii]|uniref:uncharacterized protein n=1 Tax=Durotheca rogersii TaxID=419775 RepID=UPI002220FC8B|nr:uncharacterized protein GGS23DRAFT_30907 [Durotheca rogersii]KAI5868441.1 hypothetical protein GGS23DRAFT_30907 [Durotheca rogersii]
MASNHGWKVELIPWDHQNPDHVERLYDQRVACGWRSDEVPLWVESAKKGGKIFFWIVLSDALPDRERVVQKFVKASPRESASLRDTAAEVRLVPRQPTMRGFNPIGHVALDIHTPKEDMELGLPAVGTVWIHQLYISHTLQGGGFGVGTMSKIEALAAAEPINAHLAALDTVSREVHMDPEKRTVLYGEGRLPPPRVSTEEWYIRLGYEPFRRKAGGYIWASKDGADIPSK